MAGDDSDSFEWGSDSEAEPSSGAALRILDVAGPSTLGDDSDSFESDSDGEAELYSALALMIFDAAGPSMLDSNGEAPSISLAEEYVGMGFPRELVVKGIKETGHSDALLDLLLTYTTLGDENAGNCSTSGLIPPSVGNDNNLGLANWDGNDGANGRELNPDGSGDENFLREMSGKDNKIKFLVNMGFPEDEANNSIFRCGVDAALGVLVDSIYASQAAGNCNNMDSSEYEVTDRGSDSFGGRKKARLLEESKEKMKRYGGGAKGSRPCLDGPPYFYFESVACAQQAAQDESLFLCDIEPESVDSKDFCAAARRRSYMHNMPRVGRSHIYPIQSRTIQTVFPHTRKWWPSWDTRTQLNCIRKMTAPPAVLKKVRLALTNCHNHPNGVGRKKIVDMCSDWNLIWIGPQTVAVLEPGEVEKVLGLPRDHTRGLCATDSYRVLGNSVQVDTIAYHLSVLKDLFPSGIRVLSLFSGIGGVELALDRLGIQLKVVVSVEFSEMNQNIVRTWWEQSKQTGELIQIAEVEKLKGGYLDTLVRRFDGFDVIVGGSLEDPSQFRHCSQILAQVKQFMRRT